MAQFLIHDPAGDFIIHLMARGLRCRTTEGQFVTCIYDPETLKDMLMAQYGVDADVVIDNMKLLERQSQDSLRQDIYAQRPNQ
jgi:hypothetical protein